MGEQANTCDSESGDQNPVITAYRHDVHKFTGTAHGSASERFRGVPVNETVPFGADNDAAAMSRPNGQPEQTVNAHGTHYRLSLLTGDSRYDANRFARHRLTDAIADLLTGTDPAAIHRAWLTSDVAAGFNESVYYPYSSLKYHTLLVAALVDNYRDGHDFEDLWLVVDSPTEFVPHRTIYVGDSFTLRIDGGATENPKAKLGSQPCRSWSSTWTRLDELPIDVARDKLDMLLDANLRRIWSWSTALQYIEDFQRWRDDE